MENNKNNIKFEYDESPAYNHPINKIKNDTKKSIDIDLKEFEEQSIEYNHKK